MLLLTSLNLDNPTVPSSSVPHLVSQLYGHLQLSLEEGDRLIVDAGGSPRTTQVPAGQRLVPRIADEPQEWKSL